MYCITIGPSLLEEEKGVGSLLVNMSASVRSSNFTYGHESIIVICFCPNLGSSPKKCS